MLSDSGRGLRTPQDVTYRQPANRAAWRIRMPTVAASIVGVLVAAAGLQGSAPAPPAAPPPPPARAPGPARAGGGEGAGKGGGTGPGFSLKMGGKCGGGRGRGGKGG